MTWFSADFFDRMRVSVTQWLTREYLAAAPGHDDLLEGVDRCEAPMPITAPADAAAHAPQRIDAAV